MVLENYQTIKSSNKIYYMVIEMIILIVQPYPFLNQISIQTIDFYDNFNFNFKFNYILGLFSFAKLFIVFRILLLRTNYMSPRASRNCRMYGCQSNYLFAIKCLFKDTPMLLMGIVFVISVLVFALGFRISQRNLNQQFLIQKGYENPQNLNNFQNALWLTIITMTTVGYGDFYPRTLIGRIIDVILVVWGIFIVSLMVVVLTNALNMDSSQERALIVLNRLEARNIIKQKAANLIGASFRKYMMQKKQKNNEGAGSSKALNEIILKIRKYSKQFKIVNANMRSMYQTDNIYEQMTKQFQFINDQVDFLKQNQNEVNSYLKLYLQNAK